MNKNEKSENKARKELNKCKVEIEYLLKKCNCQIVSADEWTATLIQHKYYYNVTDSI